MSYPYFISSAWSIQYMDDFEVGIPKAMNWFTVTGHCQDKDVFVAVHDVTDLTKLALEVERTCEIGKTPLS